MKTPCVFCLHRSLGYKQSKTKRCEDTKCNETQVNAQVQCAKTRKTQLLCEDGGSQTILVPNQEFSSSSSIQREHYHKQEVVWVPSNVSLLTFLLRFLLHLLRESDPEDCMRVILSFHRLCAPQLPRSSLSHEFGLTALASVSFPVSPNQEFVAAANLFWCFFVYLHDMAVLAILPSPLCSWLKGPYPSSIEPKKGRLCGNKTSFWARKSLGKKVSYHLVLQLFVRSLKAVSVFFFLAGFASGCCLCSLNIHEQKPCLGLLNNTTTTPMMTRSVHLEKSLELFMKRTLKAWGVNNNNKTSCYVTQELMSAS